MKNTKAGTNKFHRFSPSIIYPLSYPFLSNHFLFPQKYTVVIANNNFFEKFCFFRACSFLFSVQNFFRPYAPHAGGKFFHMRPCSLSAKFRRPSTYTREPPLTRPSPRADAGNGRERFHRYYGRYGNPPLCGQKQNQGHRHL